ncbi:MAG: hypothetical protein LBI60_01995 [Bacteroidales bacterium]|nr:hypothetical protein [Bacteroidales bacterium]
MEYYYYYGREKIIFSLSLFFSTLGIFRLTGKMDHQQNHAPKKETIIIT